MGDPSESVRAYLAGVIRSVFRLRILGSSSAGPLGVATRSACLPICLPIDAIWPALKVIQADSGTAECRDIEGRRIRVRWAAPDVQIHSTGVQLIHHPVVSDLDLS